MTAQHRSWWPARVQRLVVSGVVAQCLGAIPRASPAQITMPRHDSVALQAVLDSARAAARIPGISAAVVMPDGRSWQGASGLAGAGGNPARSSLLYEIGSITKTFTAALVLDLAKDGRVSLDDTLGGWVRDFPHGGGVTIRHLLQHTSGLYNYAENPEYVPALRSDLRRVWKPEDSYRYMQQPYFLPGAGWHYSNANYLLLGDVIERVTGRAFGDVLHDRLLEPLELHHTFYAAGGQVPLETAHAFLDINGDGDPEDLTALTPTTSFITAAGTAGAIVATAEDLAHWAHELYRGRVVQGAWFDAMTQWIERGDGMQYGLGVIRMSPDGRVWLGHKGNSVGYSAAVWHDTVADVTIAVVGSVHATDLTPVTLALFRRLRLPAH